MELVRSAAPEPASSPVTPGKTAAVSRRPAQEPGRVALVVPYSWSVPGGVRTHAKGLARALRARGIEVDIVAPTDAGRPSPDVIVVGGCVPVYDNGSMQRVALGPAAALRTARLIRRGGYDLVHVQEPMIPAVSLTAVLAARTPVVGTFHMYAAGPRWYRPFAPLCRWALARLDARIAVSAAAREHVCRVCPGSYHVVPNGIDVAESVAPDVRRVPGRLLFVGRAEPRKGLDVLLQAFARLPESATLDLAGVTPRSLARLATDLPRAVTSRIHALGCVSDDDRRLLVAQAEILCVPSVAGESFGLVLVEGMAAGTAIVASAVRGYVDVLGPEDALLVAPRRPVELAAAIAELLERPDLRRRMAESARRRVWRYDWQRVVDEVLEVYEEAIAHHRREAGGPGRVDAGALRAVT